MRANPQQLDTWYCVLQVSADLRGASGSAGGCVVNGGGMKWPRWFWGTVVVSVLALSGLVAGRADENDGPADSPLAVEHPECTFFSGPRERFIDRTMRPRKPGSSSENLGAFTAGVTRMLPSSGRANSRVDLNVQSYPAGSIDAYIFADFQANHITPAARTTDWEFVRRVTLDLTGRIPTADAVLTFVADGSLDKRAKLIDQLLTSPQWVDKWTMYYGDLFQNTVSKPSTGLVRYAQGRNAFYQWIHDSLANNKPYNQVASELITAAADNSYDTGTINWLIGGVVTGGPSQDIMDQMTANVADTFLGITHVNCLLCHNGRGHLDALSLWGSQTTRYQAWQLASYISHTQAKNSPIPGATGGNPYYWSVTDNPPAARTDYPLNTTTGNRPARQPVGTQKNVPPTYIFTNDTPQPGEN